MGVHESLWPGRLYETIMYELDQLKEQIKEFGLEVEADIDVCQEQYYLRTTLYDKVGVLERIFANTQLGCSIDATDEEKRASIKEMVAKASYALRAVSHGYSFAKKSLQEGSRRNECKG